MGSSPTTNIDYENLRNARILENQTRLASLGLQKTISDLRSLVSSAKSEKTQKRKYCKVEYGASSLRRSNRLKGITVNHISLRRPDRLRGKCGNLTLVPQGKGVFEDKQESLLHGEEEKRPKNTPLVKIEVSNLQLSPDALAQRCNSKGRGSVCHSTFGICCHFCRQKKLCGEEDCKRCGNLDMDQPCIGKTDCSVCHSSNGILCRACLKVRYGQDLEEVRENKEWMCPHCIEDKGMNPYWICNSSLCLQKRKMAPTGFRGLSDYENLRNARILENQTRLASLGLQKTISDLRSLVSSAKSEKTQKRKCSKVEYGGSSLRRSNRLKEITINHISLRHSDRLRGNCGNLTLVPQDEALMLLLDALGKGVFEDKQESLLRGEEEKRPKNTPSVKIEVSNLQLSPDALAQRCNSKGRGSVYHSTLGICCHFCRQKKLCGEEDCKRCGNLDMDQPCIGKTDCSVCHSSNGILCRACLRVRYGQEMDKVRENKEWMCPHCIEDKGMNPYWICNSSLCLQKRKMAPTGIAIFRARKMGYKSVAHLLMDELQQKEKRRR